MRDTFVRRLTTHARTDRNVLLMTGDLGFGVLTEFAAELPQQYINAGIAEQNMTGMAAGLAMSGKTVFTYSIANFPTLRCLEQIRNDVIYHDASVKIVAIGGGFSYGSLGMSHHATEDIAIMRALPQLHVYAPCDDWETEQLTTLMATTPGPCYFRLDKSKAVTKPPATFEPDRLRTVREGGDATLVTCGGIMVEVLAAAEMLAKEGIECQVISAHTLKPFDSESLLSIAASTPALVTIEEHVRAGGLGSIVAEVLMDAGIMPRRFQRIALPDSFLSIVGSQEYLRTRHEIDAPAIASRVRTLLKK